MPSRQGETRTPILHSLNLIKAKSNLQTTTPGPKLQKVKTTRIGKCTLTDEEINRVVTKMKEQYGKQEAQVPSAAASAPPHKDKKYRRMNTREELESLFRENMIQETNESIETESLHSQLLGSPRKAAAMSSPNSNCISPNKGSFMELKDPPSPAFGSSSILKPKEVRPAEVQKHGPIDGYDAEVIRRYL